MRDPLAVLALGLCALAAACAPRHEERRYSPPPCPPLPNPPLRADSASVVAPGEVRARLVHVEERGRSGQLVETGIPVEGAVVYVEATPSTRGTSGSGGRVALLGLPPGVHVLVRRRLGYQTRKDTLRLAPDAGAAVVVPLVLDVMDRCGWETVVRVPKPWWRFW